MTRCHVCGGHDVRRLVRKSGLNVVICTDCGLAFLDPMPDEAALAMIYGSHYYASWDLEGNAEATRQMKLATFGRLLANTSRWIRPDARVLDLGCATGFFLEAAATAGFQPFGVDIARYAIDACEARFGIGHFFCGQFEDAYFPAHPGGRFDAIFMSDYIEHVRDPRAVLALAAGRLEPGGVVVITTPNVAHRSRALMGRYWPHFKTEHLWYFSPPSLRRLLAESGMRVVETRAVHKALSMAYAATQFRQYPVPLITPGIGVLSRAMPDRLANMRLRIPTGEMTIVALRADPGSAAKPGAVEDDH